MVAVVEEVIVVRVSVEVAAVGVEVVEVDSQAVVLDKVQVQETVDVLRTRSTGISSVNAPMPDFTAYQEPHIRHCHP